MSCCDEFQRDGHPFLRGWLNLAITIKNSAVSPACGEKIPP